TTAASPFATPPVPLHSRTSGAGHFVMAGAVVSLTVTAAVHEATLPQVSLARNVTVAAAPAPQADGKNAGASFVSVAAAHTSSAWNEARNAWMRPSEAGMPPAPLHSSTRDAGQRVMTGGFESTTVSLAAQVL